MAGLKERAVQRLLVFLPPHRSVAGRGGFASSTIVTYVSGGPTGGTTTVETPIALLPKASNVDLVFDCSDLLITAIEAPKLSEAKLRLALPNLLEDRLLTEPSECHFGFEPPARASGATTLASQPKLAVAAIDRGLLTRALDALNEVGLRPRTAYSEIYTVPAPGAGVLSVRVDRGRGIARSGRHDGFGFDFDGREVPAPLALALRQLGIKRVIVFGRDAPRLVALAGELGVDVDGAHHDVDFAATESAVNLLQGSFAPGGLLGGLAIAGMPRLSWAGLRAPLVWLGVTALVFVAGMNAYWLKLQSEVQRIRVDATAAFRSNFPDYTSVSDDVGVLAQQTEREMNRLRARAGLASPTDFSVLNAQTAQLLSMAPVGSVAGVEYRDGAMRVKFKPGTATDPGLQNALRGQAIQQGLNLRFEADGSARVAPSGG